MTDDYLALFAKNWDFLAPKLGLKSLTMDIGREMRAGITGTQGEAVTIVTIFQAHQKSVLESMAGNSDGQAEFDTLKSKIMIQFDQAQTDDSDPSTPETKQPLAAIRRRISTLFGALDNGLSPADASKVKTALTSMFTDVGRMAQSELEASNVEWALRQEASPTVVDAARPYNADQETALNAKEREKFAALLSKPRFTQADFEQLDAFYAGPYDKLSARGKDELSYRVWGGMRAQKSD
jgi:cytochrome c556